jgi:hypothetical protein
MGNIANVSGDYSVSLLLEHCELVKHRLSSPHNLLSFAARNLYAEYHAARTENALARVCLLLKQNLFTVYSHPEHPAGVVYQIKGDAVAHLEE